MEREMTDFVENREALPVPRRRVVAAKWSAYSDLGCALNALRHAQVTSQFASERHRHGRTTQPSRSAARIALPTAAPSAISTAARTSSANPSVA